MMLSMTSGKNRGPTSVLTGRGSLPDDTKFCRVFGEQQRTLASSEYEYTNTLALFSGVMISSEFDRPAITSAAFCGGRGDTRREPGRNTSEACASPLKTILARTNGAVKSDIR